MASEIERKFLIDQAPDWLDDCECERISQGYLAVVEAEREVRLRRRGDDAFLTVKIGSGESRREEEIRLHNGQLEALWECTEQARVFKSRYEVPLDELTAVVDVYEQELSGLIAAEVEFSSTEQAKAFEAPEWFGRELTGEHGYANQSLALHGRPTSSSA